MAKIYHLFSNAEPHPKTHNLASANALLPIVRRYTDEAIRQTQNKIFQLKFQTKGSEAYKRLMREHEEAVGQWVERIHRLGALAKGLWLVDFDTGHGYLCWCHPEKRVDHFHFYKESFKDRRKIQSEKDLKSRTQA